jgi:membrane-bound lytic murein transglycosylase
VQLAQRRQMAVTGELVVDLLVGSGRRAGERHGHHGHKREQR